MIINSQMAKSIQQIEKVTKSSTTSDQIAKQGNASFQNILNKQLEKSEELTFSKHATDRLATRDIVLSEQQLERLNQGVESAREKGIKESLMVMDNISLIVNVENATVITALDSSESKEHVFTNIDGAVLL
jgi:flagellar operon protein